MAVYNYSEVQQNFSIVLDTALKEDVVITRSDGSKFKLISISENTNKARSPLEDIKGIKTNITMVDILEAIREGRRRHRRLSSGVH
jgi:PHD/YefM family antitoxin component YafN of YafNO toxin-antitoxin module